MTEQPKRSAVVRISSLSKRFGATQALDNVSLDIRSGEVLALLGANGAGKSTLIKILAGVYSADSGGTQSAAGGGLEDIRFAFIHQDLGLVEWMSVAESVALGSGYPRRAALINWRGVRRMATEALRNVAPHLNVDAPISSLSRADRSLVAIARALYAKSDVLVLDEPTASLHASDCEQLFSVLRQLRDEGVAIVYVSHRLDEIFKVADRVAVLRDGRLVADDAITGFTPAAVVEAIVGGKTNSFELGNTNHGAAVLEVRELAGEGVRQVSFELRAGEVLGLIGLNGAGQREVGRMIAGALPHYAGDLSVSKSNLRDGVAAAVRTGVSLITSSRAEEQLAMGLTVRENYFPNRGVRGDSSLQLLNVGREHDDAAALADRFNVKPRDHELTVATLSGGNQQKVILARWLSMPRSVIVLEEPTAGVDVGAKSEIYRLIDEATAEGLAVLLVSTDFEEVALVAHRALVFADGSVVAELSRSEISVQSLITHASLANVSA